MGVTYLPRAALRPKADGKIGEYLALSRMQALSVGLYVGGRCYVLALNDDEEALFYEIGSISKTLTAHLILSLSQRGLVALDTHVSDYLTLKKGSYPTIRELLTHTAGYGHLTPLELTLPRLIRHRYSHRNPYQGVKADRVIKCLERRRWKKKDCPYGYSDFSYAILALIAEKVGEKPFSEQIVELIQKGFQMEQTGLCDETHLPPSVYHGKPIPGWRWEADEPYLAGGGIVSNVYDMLTYMRLQIESDAPMITAAHQVCEGSFSKKKNVGTCMGWHTYKKSDQLWHVGGVGTFRSSVIVNRKRKLGVVVLGNTIGARSANVHYIAKMLYSELKLKKIKVN